MAIVTSSSAQTIPHNPSHCDQTQQQAWAQPGPVQQAKEAQLQTAEEVNSLLNALSKADAAAAITLAASAKDSFTAAARELEDARATLAAFNRASAAGADDRLGYTRNVAPRLQSGALRTRCCCHLWS